MKRVLFNFLMGTIKLVKWILLAPVFILLILIAFLIVGPIEDARARYRAARAREFCGRESGSFYLIGTSKRHWYDFLRNNVIPVLPDGERVVWPKNTRDGACPEFRKTFGTVTCMSRPCLVYIGERCAYWKSLNLDLQELKPFAKRSAETQAACRSIIEQAMQELRGRD
jgi:hypothetical protein